MYNSDQNATFSPQRYQNAAEEEQHFRADFAGRVFVANNWDYLRSLSEGERYQVLRGANVPHGWCYKDAFYQD